jgi:hypothetical protein
MLNSCLKRLNEIEKLEPHPSTDEEVLDLMQQISSVRGGLQKLVERFSGSTNPIIVRSLSFLVAKLASSPEPETWQFIFTLIENLRCQGDESTLINCLTAIQRQLIVEFPCKTSWRLSSELYPFLMYCLQQSNLVKRGVIAILARLYEDLHLADFFDSNQIEKLREKLSEISEQHDEMLALELKGLSGFLNNE